MSPDSSKVSALMAARPRYIVVFRERSERNTSTLSTVLQAGEAKGLSLRASMTVLQSQKGFARVYNRMAVAATDLDDEQVAELKRNETVLAVVPNERRTIPRPVDAAGLGVAAGRGAPDALTGYVEGLRDAANAILLRLGSSTAVLPAPRPAAAQADDPSFSWCLSLIGMTPGYRGPTGAGVGVAVLDTGLDLTHPDFQGRVVDGDNGMSFVPGVGVQDGHGHGTHCCGVVAGPAASTGGRRYGVAPDVRLIVGKVLDDQGSGNDDQIMEGMDWARDYGARILSMSLGAARPAGQPYNAAYEQIASVMLADGVLVVAAAGNESNRPAYRAPVGDPAACPSIMAVAAVDRDRQVGYFSSAQLDSIGLLDVSGPGVAVYSSFTGGGFRSLSGTSMATPHVAGVAALYRQAYPDHSGQALWNQIASRCVNLGDASDFGRGLVQVP